MTEINTLAYMPLINDYHLVLVLGMPTGTYVYAKDLNDVLKKKHAAKAYKSMVIQKHLIYLILIIFFFFFFWVEIINKCFPNYKYEK